MNIQLRCKVKLILSRGSMNEASKITRLNFLINEKYQSLGAKEKKIADYMLSHEEEILSMPIASLADRAEVSQPTAVRFCKKLGFNGIKEFKIFLSSIKCSSSTSPCAFKDNDETIFEKVFMNSISALESSFKSTSAHTIALVADLINASENVLIFGTGGSQIAASFTSGELSRFGKKVYAYTDNYALKQFRAEFATDDIALFVSRSGETAEILRIAEQAKSNGASVIAITTNSDSTLYRIADHSLLVSEKQLMDDDRNSFSRVGQIALVSCLYIMCVEHKMRDDKNFKDNYFGLTNYK